jgi:hypothetical protein
MYPIGVPIAVDAFLASGLTTWLVVAILTLCALLLAIAHPKEKDDNFPPSLPGWIPFDVWRFFNRRFDFLNSGFRLVGEDIFQFKLLHVRVGLQLIDTLIDDVFESEYRDCHFRAFG